MMPFTPVPSLSADWLMMAMVYRALGVSLTMRPVARVFRIYCHSLSVPGLI